MASCSTSSAVAELRGVDGGGFCDSFRLGPPLGEGSTSLVLQALASDGSRRALKLALRSSMASNGWSRAVRILHRESLILKQMGAHEHIAGWCDWFASSNAVAIMLELGEGGDFQQALRAHGPLDELMLRPVVRQLCSALAHLHSQQFVHRDVKLENLLCSDAAWPPSRLLLCDFGHACAISDAEADREFLGTPGYAPPEVIKGPSWSYCADLFSCGVVIYALIADTLPIVCWPDGAEGPPDISGRAWWSVSVEAKLLLLALLSIDPNERPGVEAVRRGSWLESAAAGTSHAVPRGYSEPLLDASRHACTEIAKNDGREDTEGARPAEPPLGRVISAHGLSLSALSIASTTTADSVAGRRVPLSQMHSRRCLLRPSTDPRHLR